jgi:hypothetical protein
MPTATVRRRVAASNDRSGTPPNCELHGRDLQRALNVDFGHARRKGAAMVYIGTNAL